VGPHVRLSGPRLYMSAVLSYMPFSPSAFTPADKYLIHLTANTPKRHKVLGERYHVLRDKDSDVEHDPTQGSDLSDTDGGDEAEVPFIPPHASLGSRTHYLSDPYKARLTSPSGVYAASSATRNPAYPVRRS
jgi:hypothetical protein